MSNKLKLRFHGGFWVCRVIGIDFIGESPLDVYIKILTYKPVTYTRITHRVKHSRYISLILGGVR